MTRGYLEQSVYLLIHCFVLFYLIRSGKDRCLHFPLRRNFQHYYDIPDETVARMFIRCGLVSNGELKRCIVNRLSCEGLTSLEKNGHQNEKCLSKFLEWVNLNDLEYELCPVHLNF